MIIIPDKDGRQVNVPDELHIPLFLVMHDNCLVAEVSTATDIVYIPEIMLYYIELRCNCRTKSGLGVITYLRDIIPTNSTLPDQFGTMTTTFFGTKLACRCIASCIDSPRPSKYVRIA